MKKLLKFTKTWFWFIALVIAILLNLWQAWDYHRHTWFPIPTAAQQRFLFDRGYDIPVDGLGGPKTDAALLADYEGRQ